MDDANDPKMFTSRDDARYKAIMQCMKEKKTWEECTQLAVLWHDRVLPSRRKPESGRKPESERTTQEVTKKEEELYCDILKCMLPKRVTHSP